MKTQIAVCACLLLLSVSFSFAKTGEVCFPFGSSESSEASPQSIQGRPGKIGPRGPPGLQGEVGEPGSPGTCACDPNEIEQLREEIRLRDVEINSLRKNPNLKIVICGVGLKDGEVPDRDITASRYQDSRYQPKFARLDRQGTNEHFGGWLGCIHPCGRGEWIQVDLRQPTRVVAVVTHGLDYPGPSEQWVTSYKISYGNSTSSMQVIKTQSNSDLVFNGNNAVGRGDAHVINEFPSPITARYFRLIVETWHVHATVRLEYLTC